MTTHEILDLSPTTLTYGGDCMGRLPDGRAVFIPFVLPGEQVRARLVEEKRGHARAELVEVLTPSPDRIAPHCPHFFSLHCQRPSGGEEPEWGYCGGCHYQHMPYLAQLAVKTAIIRDQLERIGGILNPPVRPIVPSPNLWNYRNHIQFHLTPDGQLGYESLRTNDVIPIRECHLPEAALNEIWPQLDLEAVEGLERVSLRLGSDDEIMLILESDEPLELTVEGLAVSVAQIGSGGTMVLAGSDHLVMEVGRRPFRVSTASFFQVNTPLAAAMVDHLLAHLPISQSTTLLEVYCGVGLFSAFLAPRVARFIGIEASPSACEDFSANLDEFEHVELYEAAAEDALPALDICPDVILVDPPRAGLGRRALESILALGAPSLAYISCDPATLARDARRLIEGGYRLQHITPFDLFPQTYHIESISIWEK